MNRIIVLVAALTAIAWFVIILPQTDANQPLRFSDNGTASARAVAAGIINATKK